MYDANEVLSPLDLSLPKEMVDFMVLVARQNDIPVQELAQYMLIDSVTTLAQEYHRSDKQNKEEGEKT